MYNDNRSFTEYEDSVTSDRNQFFHEADNISQSVMSSLRGVSRDSFCTSNVHIAEDPMELLECGEMTEDHEAYYQVEPVQRTVDSAGAVSVDTQDSGLFKDAPLPCGNIQFWSESMEQAEFQVSGFYFFVISVFRCFSL